MAELLSAQKSLDSGILKLAPSPGVNSAIKLLYMPAHYCEYQHPWYLNEKKLGRLSGPYTSLNSSHSVCPR